MRRRDFLALFGGAAAWPLVARAQQTRKVARVGMLIPAALDSPATREVFGVVRQGLADFGYVEGRDLIFEQRGGDGTSERLIGYGASPLGLNRRTAVNDAFDPSETSSRDMATILAMLGVCRHDRI